jgi:hypothetical protein
MFWKRGRDLKSVLNETKKIKIDGVLFEIQKLKALDYMTGAEVLTASFATWEDKRKSDKASKDLDKSIKKIQDHYKEVFLSCVIKPKLSRTEDGDGIFVEEMFKDFDMCANLYLEIANFTYGKKKLKSLNI